MLHVGADEDQTAGSELAFAGGDPGADAGLSSFEFGLLLRQFLPEILRFVLVRNLEISEAEPRLVWSWLQDIMIGLLEGINDTG